MSDTDQNKNSTFPIVQDTHHADMFEQIISGIEDDSTKTMHEPMDISPMDRFQEPEDRIPVNNNKKHIKPASQTQSNSRNQSKVPDWFLFCLIVIFLLLIVAEGLVVLTVQGIIM